MAGHTLWCGLVRHNRNHLLAGGGGVSHRACVCVHHPRRVQPKLVEGYPPSPQFEDNCEG